MADSVGTTRLHWAQAGADLAQAWTSVPAGPQGRVARWALSSGERHNFRTGCTREHPTA